MELHSKEQRRRILKRKDEDVEIAIPKKGYISPEKRRQTINELRLVSRKDEYFQKLLMN